MSEPPAYSVAQEFGPAPKSQFQTGRHYLLYASEGTMRLEAKGRTWTLPPARAALITAGEPIDVTLPVRITCRSVLYAVDFVDPPEQVLSVFDVSPLARELILEVAQWGPDDASLSGYARELFKTLATVAWRLSLSPSNLYMPAGRSDAVKKVLALTEESLGKTLEFDHLADVVALSPRSLARRISSELGMNWRQALQRLRVMKAVEALSLSDLPVTEIAFEQGYQSLSAFNSAFRELTGKTPSEYRASFRMP
ncbi:AraC family transcriptional regulator [Labrenzia sp. PHM005]|uniref:AraC family transcriptional regulator n=1 Tax=Labrenzia sp. PHM005 TaxID=2590016 RepID=UPI0011401911|nr:AraC family transcriptional regulator [Labrenzia sp. PHM005]QDG76901.1 helix-turn-helix domain-containing protein [Labrenzia sp. PHM005]